MTVSVIMPAFNGEATIQAALDSILAQASPPHEIIVVDDGSTDDTAAVVATYGARVQYHWQANAGPAAARNAGLTLATGDLLAFLDADDLWPVDTLRVLGAALAEQPTAAIAQGLVRDVWPAAHSGSTVGEPRRGVNLGSALFRRTVFDAVGRFNPRLRQSEDTEFWIRITEQGLLCQMVDRVTLVYHRRATTPDDVQQFRSLWLHNLKRSLDRQRAR